MVVFASSVSLFSLSALWWSFSPSRSASAIAVSPQLPPIRIDSGEADQSRIAEARHLRRSLGGAIWPGWEQANIPVILYNERYAFLVGYPNPPAGWTKVPQNETRGRAWELVPGGTIEGEPYYRQPLVGGVHPEAFTVMVGDRWVASLPTLEWTRISIANRIRAEVPSALARIVPYELVTALFIGGSDGWITLLLHESFHAWQGALAPERVAQAEGATALEGAYEARMPALEQRWIEELALLRKGTEVSSPAEARKVARDFLTHRRARRQTLPAALVEYERRREWLEGLAKYVELVSWREAASAGYSPLLSTEKDPGFAGYRGYGRKWSREKNEMKRAASSGDVRFYYSGMAQAMLLELVDPEWKARAISGTRAPDQLIEDALAAPRERH